MLVLSICLLLARLAAGKS